MTTTTSISFDEFDQKKIEQARKLLWEVYSYNFGFTPHRRKVDRLATIISKIDQLMVQKGGKDRE